MNIRNPIRIGFPLLASVTLLALASAEPTTVPRAEIDSVNARYASLGVAVPKDGIILEQPFAPPYTNRSFIVPPEWFFAVPNSFRDNPKMTISASALRADLPTLHFLMRNVYADYDQAQMRGWNWDRWFASWDARLARAGERQISLRDAMEPWSEEQNALPDGHTGPEIPQLFERGERSVSAELLEPPTGACRSLIMSSGHTITLQAGSGISPREVLEWDGKHFGHTWYLAYPQREGTAVAAACGGARVPARMTAQPTVGADAPRYQTLGGGISYLRTPWIFQYESNAALRRVLASVPTLGSERILILDLRGNGGGAAPLDVLQHWFSSEELSNTGIVETRTTTQSCYLNALYFNIAQYYSYTLKPPISQEQHTMLQRQVDSIATTPAQACDVKRLVTKKGGPPGVQRPFTMRRSNSRRTRVMVVVDNGCGSDCDGLARLLSRLPDTVLVGTGTYGGLGSGGSGTAVPSLLVLPNTRIPFLIGTVKIQFADARGAINDYAVPVDILLPTQSSQSIGSLLALARHLSE